MRPTHALRFPSNLLSALASHNPTSIALSSEGAVLTYRDLARLAVAGGRTLRNSLPREPPVTNQSTARLAFLTPPLSSYASTLLSCWVAGATAVPLSPLYPPPALGHIVADCSPSVLVTAPPYSAAHVASPEAGPLPHVLSRSLCEDSGGRPDDFEDLPALAAAIPAARPAMLIYTSGTTGAPKGVVWTHAMVDYQVATLSDQWRWSSGDRILNVLPLHHVHGIVNVLLTALYSGAHCEMMPKFSAQKVWDAICGGEPPTVFMGVPTIYQRLIQFYDAAGGERARMREAASRLRLYVCGSAALSVADLEAWQRISGHRILERYGMTETGMLLSNGYDDRRPASLGVPLPGVEAKVIPDGGGREVVAWESCGEVDGVLCVRGAGVFSEYWNRTDETSAAFDSAGWFYTGDVVRMDALTGRCSMLGRESTDFINTGGFKVSALEIESAVTQHHSISSCAVVGVSDKKLGEVVACAAVLKDGELLSTVAIHDWLAKRLPMYKVPRLIHFVEADFLPRNALGKVQKKVLSRRLEAESASEEVNI